MKEHPMRYKDLIHVSRYHYDEYEEWKHLYEDLHYRQKDLLLLRNAIVSDEHFDLIFKYACETPDCVPSLELGMHIAIFELREASSGVV
jgi:hypothetical protein